MPSCLCDCFAAPLMSFTSAKGNALKPWYFCHITGEMTKKIPCFCLAVYNIALVITTIWPYSMLRNLSILIWGLCGFKLNQLLCMDLTSNHKRICISWKEKAPQLPEHKGQRKRLIYGNKINSGLSLLPLLTWTTSQYIDYPHLQMPNALCGKATVFKVHYSIFNSSNNGHDMYHHYWVQSHSS